MTPFTRRSGEDSLGNWPKMRVRRLICELSVSHMLEEIAATLEDAKVVPYIGFEPQGIIESWAMTAVFCDGDKFKNRLKEFCVND